VSYQKVVQNRKKTKYIKYFAQNCKKADLKDKNIAWIFRAFPRKDKFNKKLINHLKKSNVNVRWFDSVPGTNDFQAVKFTAEDFRRNQPKLST
jgi:alcohol dehydrogenase class IV